MRSPLLEELNRQTEQAMAAVRDESKRSTIPLERVELVAAYKKMGIDFGAETQSYENRVALAESLGFRPLSIADAVREMSGGEAHDVATDWGTQRHIYGWFFDHTGDTPDGWGSIPTIYTKHHKLSAFPGKKVKWSFVFGAPNHLRRKIPPGIAMAMVDAAKLNLFNCFSVIAPEEMWKDEPSKEPDPIMLANIAKIGQKAGGGNRSFLDVTRFFFARWEAKERLTT